MKKFCILFVCLFVFVLGFTNISEASHGRRKPVRTAIAKVVRFVGKARPVRRALKGLVRVKPVRRLFGRG